MAVKSLLPGDNIMLILNLDINVCENYSFKRIVTVFERII